MNRHTRRMELLVTLALVAVSAVTQNISAAVIASHSGATDPTLEGWTLQQRDNGTVGPVIDDSGLGVNAWKIVDPDTEPGLAIATYHGESMLTLQALTDIAAGGWAMRINLRVDDLIANGFNQQPDQAPGLQVALADTLQWAVLKLGQDSNSNTTVQLAAGYDPNTGLMNESSIMTISGNGYHTFELRGRSTGSLVDLYVDGTKMVNGLSDANLDAGFAAALGNRIFWGAQDTPGIGAGYYNSVQFETAPAPIPEPAMLAFVLTGLLTCAWRRRA